MNPEKSYPAMALQTAPADSNEPTFDHAYLARFTLGDLALEREVLQLFAAQAPIYVDNLLAADTPEAWVDAAHTLKSSAGALGIRHLAQLAAAAEGFDVFAAGEAKDRFAARAEIGAVLREALAQALAAIDAVAAPRDVR